MSLWIIFWNRKLMSLLSHFRHARTQILMGKTINFGVCLAEWQQNQIRLSQEIKFEAKKELQKEFAAESFWTAAESFWRFSADSAESTKRIHRIMILWSQNHDSVVPKMLYRIMILWSQNHDSAVTES